MGMSTDAVGKTWDLKVHENKRLRAKYGPSNPAPLLFDTYKSDAGIFTGAVGRGAPILGGQLSDDPLRFAYNMGLGVVAGKAIGVGIGKVRPYTGLQVRNVGPKTIMETRPSEPLRTIDLRGVKDPFKMSGADDIIGTADKNIKISERINARDAYANSLLENPLTGKPGLDIGHKGKGCYDSVGNFIPDEPTIKTIKVNQKVFSVEQMINPFTKRMTGYSFIGMGVAGLNKTKTKNEVFPTFAFTQRTKTMEDGISGLTSPQTTKQKSLTMPVYTMMPKTKTATRTTTKTKTMFDTLTLTKGRTNSKGFFKLGGGGRSSSRGPGFKLFDRHDWVNAGIFDVDMDFGLAPKKRRKRGGRKR
jgi:hypothetical protein